MRKGGLPSLPPEPHTQPQGRRRGGRLEAIAVSIAIVVELVGVSLVGVAVLGANDPSRGMADAHGRVPPVTSPTATPTAAPSSPRPSAAGFVGNQNIEGSADPSSVGTVEATRYVTTAGGAVTSLSIYLDASNRATSFALGLYSDAGGAPGTLLAQGSRTGAQNGAWNTVAVAATTITTGSSYWIARLATRGGDLVTRVNPGVANSDRVDKRALLTTIPNTFTVGGSFPHLTSIYAGTTSPSTNAVPTPTPTTAPTRTPTPSVIGAPTMTPMPSTSTMPTASPMPSMTSMPTMSPMPSTTPPTAGLYAPIPGCAGGTTVPMGQANPSAELEPMGEIWCFNQFAEPTTRRVDSRGGWTDAFNTGVQMGHLRNGEMGYQVLNAFNALQMRGGTFLNNDHWMVDLVDESPYRLSGGVMLSPNQAFRFENGKLVVEADAAAGQDGAGGADVFYEIDITPAATSTGTVVDPLYGYGQFGGIGAIGCRMERQTDGGHTVCAMYDATTHDTGGTDVGPLCNQPPNFDRTNCHNGLPGRVWETQGLGIARTAPTVVGGFPGYQIPGTTLRGSDVFRVCNSNQMDMFCRDRFRIELTKTSLTIFVNGAKWFDVQGLYASNPATGADNRIPDSWLGPNGVHVYFTSWVNSGQHYPVRYHWGRLAVNPHDGAGNLLPPSAAPTYCFGQMQNTCAMH